jgi:predicted deacylase
MFFLSEMNRVVTIIFILFFLMHPDKTFPQHAQNQFVFSSLPDSVKDSIQSIYIHHSNPDINELDKYLNSKTSFKTVLGYSLQHRPVEAWYFPGTSNERALVVGGMHGSELSSLEVAAKVIELLSSGQKPYYNVIIIPVLFPDNAASALKAERPGITNKGRYTTEMHADPNRQMPAAGKAFSIDDGHDHAGRIIENENRMLLQLIQQFRPSRIVNLHAIRDITKAGIYADPRTDCKGIAIGFNEDSTLAVSMAQYIHFNGGKVPGNRIEKRITALYYNDPPAASKGMKQKRNLHGSSLPGNRGYGVSLGGWASTAVCGEENSRDAIILITVEFPGYRPSYMYAANDKKKCLLNILLYAGSIQKLFLSVD